MRLNDVQEEILSKAEGLIAANLQTLVELGFLEQKDAAATLSRILTTSRIEEAGRDADFVIEAITEDQNAKKVFFSITVMPLRKTSTKPRKPVLA